MTIKYENFDLLIEATADGYRARVLDSPIGQGKVDFVLPFSAIDLQAFLGLSARAIGNMKLASPLATSAAPLDPQRFGTRLYDAALGGAVGTCLVRSMDETARNGTGLRIRLRIDDSIPDVADLPWEFLYVRPNNRFLALSEETALVRYLELPRQSPPLQISPPLKILVVIAAPTDLAQLDVDAEWARINEALLVLQGHGLIKLELLTDGTITTLQARLRQPDPIHILHYMGHGYFDVDRNIGGLYFENEAGAKQRVDADDIGTLLHDHESLRLLFLNSCEGANGGWTDAFAGTAQRLIQQGVPAILAMQFAVTDDAAITLAQTFYRATADGYPLDAAVAAARKAVKLSSNPHEWATPVLFSRADDNQILVMPQGDAQPVLDIQYFEPETVLVSGGPFLMGSDSDDENEKPQHEVYLPDFRIGKTPVTNAQYAEFLKRNPKQLAPKNLKKLEWFLRKPPKGTEHYPVAGVSWYDAQAYCAWLRNETGRTYQLPSEAQWEKAARGTNGQRYPWGDEWCEGYANLNGDAPTPVAEHLNGASPYGCLDMIGNVQEWTNTLWGSDRAQSNFPNAYNANDGREVSDVERAMNSVYRIHRGGSFRSKPAMLRCSVRGRSGPDSAIHWRGFRVGIALE